MLNISVSSIQDFQRCPLRWCFKYLENRVPRYEPTAFTVGKLVHTACEEYFTDGPNPPESPGHALEEKVNTATALLLDERENQALKEVSELIEPLKKWTDFYPIEETLEVEVSHSVPLWHDTIAFRIKPDRVVRIKDHIYHMQHKTIAAQRDVGTFVEVASHSLHELTYAWVLQSIYPQYTYGGSIYNLVRKLKYKSAAKATPGKILHQPHEFFSQWIVATDPDHIKLAVSDIHTLAKQMQNVADAYWGGDLPPANRREDEDFFSKRTDPYFDVLMGRATLSDDTRFMDREDHHAPKEEKDD